jgi:hypothetical protein
LLEINSHEPTSPSPLEEEDIDRKCQDKFIEHMYNSLMRSQCSIYVTSATCKVIAIKKEDKTFLNEALKQSINQVILA